MVMYIHLCWLLHLEFMLRAGYKITNTVCIVIWTRKCALLEYNNFELSGGSLGPRTSCSTVRVIRTLQCKLEITFSIA